ncbi:MAG: hypothetical protein KDB14_16740 [Planctomycetales bacterium]|nr:hypothetical protein [Planctomycetales bacterium]
MSLQTRNCGWPRMAVLLLPCLLGDAFFVARVANAVSPLATPAPASVTAATSEVVPAPAPAKVELERPLEFSQTVDRGILVINREYLQAPYLVEADKNHVTVNGRVVDASTWFGVVTKRPPARRPQFRAAGMWRGWGRRPAPAPAASVPTDETELLTTDNASGLMSPRGRAFELAGTLEGDGIVLADGDRVEAVCHPTLQRNLLATILEIPVNDTPSHFQHEATQWISAVSNIDPLRTQAQTRWDALEEVEAANYKSSKASRRISQLAYPMTVFGMVLTVFSLGHLLQAAPRIETEEQWRANLDQWKRVTTISIVLFVTMSALDLTWTLMASQANQMQELNPIANLFIDSPAALVVFKLTATLISGGILLSLREHARAQRVAWWACLLCTMLTMRWVVFNSMFVS